MPSKKIKRAKVNGGNRILAPKPVPENSSNHMHPAFCFKFCQKKFTIDDCDKDTKALLADKIYKLSQVNWGELQRNNRHGLGHEIISKDSISVAVPLTTPDDREFLCFRLGGGKNSVFIGYRVAKIFYVVWVDPNGQVYEH